MFVWPVISILPRLRRRRVVKVQTKVRGASISIEMVNSPFDDHTTQNFVAGIRDYLTLGLLTGKPPESAELPATYPAANQRQ